MHSILRRGFGAAILATALAALPLWTEFAHSAANAAEEHMYIVMVEFPVEAGQSDEVVATVRGLLDSLVSKQEGFQSARIHRATEGGKVVNYMQWRRKEDFDAFRAAHKDQVTAAVGKFGPKFFFYEVVHTAEPPR